jgi:hypothetical protein
VDDLSLEPAQSLDIGRKRRRKDPARVENKVELVEEELISTAQTKNQKTALTSLSTGLPSVIVDTFQTPRSSFHRISLISVLYRIFGAKPYFSTQWTRYGWISWAEG